MAVEMSPSAVSAYLLSNPEFTRTWFIQNVGKESLTEWVESASEKENILTPMPRTHSLKLTTSAEFASTAFKGLMEETKRRRASVWIQQNERKSKHKLTKSEREVFFDLIRDIATELDVNVLCYKILTNVGILTKSDRGSLFLRSGPKTSKMLVSKLFDVTESSSLEDCLVTSDKEIFVPFGVGIAGAVAEKKSLINIKDCYNDPRFNQEVDKKTGFRTENLLCMPILNYEGELIGVAQIMNKTDGSKGFTKQDEETFQTYLGFCGIGLANAQLFEMSVMESKRNQVLLQLARNIFEEQSNLDNLVQKIMLDAKDLLSCEQCNVFLVDKALEAESEVSKKYSAGRKNNIENISEYCSYEEVKFVKGFEFEGSSESDAKVISMPDDDLATSKKAEIAKKVVYSGEATYMDAATSKELNGNKTINSVLSIPIRDTEKKVIGVVQLLNKLNGKSFNDNDANTAEAFAIFCGLGIHNCIMYENCATLMAKQSVAFEVLSYHASAPPEETNKLKSSIIPSGDALKMYDFGFDDDTLSEFQTCQATVRMFLDCGVCTKYQVPYEVLCRWVLSVKKNYRPVTYHNWRHGFNVTQTMFTMIYSGQMNQYMTDIEIFGLLVACLCHDLDHRGTNNAFQSKSDSPLATLYSTSTMEHHHFDQCIMILNSQENNIFQKMSNEDYRRVIKIVEGAILSTDLALYFKKKGTFQELVAKGTADWKNNAEHRETLRGMMMTACDVSAIAKPWEVQKRVAHLVAGEFFEQGDIERAKLNQEPMAMMDRKKKDELPSMQVGFIDAICMPVYQVLAQIEPNLHPLFEGCLNNRCHWQTLAETDEEKTNLPLDNKRERENQEEEKKSPENKGPGSKYSPAKRKESIPRHSSGSKTCTIL